MTRQYASDPVLFLVLAKDRDAAKREDVESHIEPREIGGEA
jgi:hypothetical protein